MSLPTTHTEPSEHPDAPPTPRRGVAVYNINPGTVEHHFAQSLRSLLIHDVTTSQHIVGDFQRAGGGLTLMRNAAVAHFINETRAEWMWFLDSDIYLPMDTLDILMAKVDPTSLPVLMGMYITSLPEGLVPCAWGMDGEILDADETARLIKDGTKTVEVTRTGAGCSLVHHSVLQAMYNANPENPWYDEPVINGVRIGEDFAFCENVRRLGYKIYLDLEVDLGHVKTIIFNKEMLGNVRIEVVDEGTQVPLMLEGDRR